jgi:hypothetical protein
VGSLVFGVFLDVEDCLMESRREIADVSQNVDLYVFIFEFFVHFDEVVGEDLEESVHFWLTSFSVFCGEAIDGQRFNASIKDELYSGFEGFGSCEVSFSGREISLCSSSAVSVDDNSNVHWEERNKMLRHTYMEMKMIFK